MPQTIMTVDVLPEDLYNPYFSEEELEQLSDEVNQQLQHLMSVVSEPSETRGDEPDDLALLPPTQADAIAQITQEPPKTFLQKFAKAAKTELPWNASAQCCWR